MFSISLFGDVMPGRLLSHPPKHVVDESIISFVADSQLNIANLECVITDSSPAYSQLKRNPKEYSCKHASSKKQGLLLKTLNIGCCNLANNHILDYGFEGVKDTIHFLTENSIKWFGFGRNWDVAWKPRILKLPSGTQAMTTRKQYVKLAVFGLADHFVEWRADDGAGINYFDIGNFQRENKNMNRARWQDIDCIYEQIAKVRSSVDLVIFSIHWGENFQEEVSETFKAFAHALVDMGVDIIHGHSTHHFQGIEWYKQKLILYGCGDFINDYDMYEDLLQATNESFGEDYRKFRSDLAFVYKIHLASSSSQIHKLELLPVSIKRGSVFRSTEEEFEESHKRMQKACDAFGTKLHIENGLLVFENTVTFVMD